jgi:putative autoinducer-2 (AI-2) aldolase
MITWLPTVDRQPFPSSPLIAETPEGDAEAILVPWTVTGLRLSTEQVVKLLCASVGKQTLASGIIIGKDLAHEGITPSVQEVIRLNVAAVGMSIFVGSEYEYDSLLNLGKLVDECENYGLPVMAVTAVGKELERRDARYLGLCCRIAAELGTKIVKTYWCENFEKVVNGCPVPVVIAGGPKCETEREVFDFVYDGMQKGAIGLNLGRNVWQHEHPVAMMKALRAIIHEKATPKDAEEIFTEEKRKK